MADIQRMRTRLKTLEEKARELEKRIQREERRAKPVPHPGYVPQTLCEVCDNACGFCSWSTKGEQLPVKGWRAVRRDLVIQASVLAKRSDLKESYVVLECPEFVIHPGEEWALERFDPGRAAERVSRKATVYGR